LARPLLDVSRLDVFRGGAQVLRGVTFQVFAGEVCVLIGPNGSGKTTLFETLAGALRPASGEVMFAGSRIDGLPPDALPDVGLSLVPEGRGLFLQLTVRENLLLGAFPKRARPALEDSLARVLERFPQLGPMMKQTAGNLSGGEQQMVAIGRALMANPRLLLLDEPSLGLAPAAVRALFDAIVQLKAGGVTVLLAEQRVRQALTISDRGYLLHCGRIVRAGRASDLSASPDICGVYMGAPAGGAV
jgi:branched-chain amino acid transport system ATP-binding protein